MQGYTSLQLTDQPPTDRNIGVLNSSLKMTISMIVLQLTKVI